MIPPFKNNQERIRVGKLFEILGCPAIQLEMPKNGWSTDLPKHFKPELDGGVFTFRRVGDIDYKSRALHLVACQQLPRTLMVESIRQLEMKARRALLNKLVIIQMPHIAHLVLKFHELN